MQSKILMTIFASASIALAKPIVDVTQTEEARSVEPHLSQSMSYSDCVSTGIAKVLEIYPDAKLYEAEAGGRDLRSITDPNEFQQLNLTFRAEHGTAKINTINWCTFGEVGYIPEPWLGDVVISWPVKMDTNEANKLREHAGYTGPFETCLLRFPVAWKVNETSFIFSLQSEYVFVGVQSKKVSTEPR